MEDAMGSLEGQFDTKLHEAVRYGDVDEVRVALNQGYDPNLIGVYHWSALHEAAYNGEKEILKLLLDKKGDPNKPDYQLNRTATHYATVQGHIECLRMLLDAGGRYDIKDSDGKDCLDLATPNGRKILEKLKVKDLMLKDDNKDKDEGISTDPSPSVSTSRRSSISSLQDQGPALGYMHLSVEYHAAKSSLKIRIWQLTDLLLPPPSTSMIHSIYVKSYLQPDKKRETKRKTEEIKVDSEGYIHWRRKKEHSVQHVFKPSNFKFNRCLEYTGITSEHIKEKLLQIEVCLTQRYSHRSYLIGIVRMSLKSAVKKLVKEKLPLIPCMNHTIPTNMKVYCASDLNVMNNTAGGDYFYSSPNVRIELPDELDDNSVKAVSDPDLQPKQIHSPSTEVDMNQHYRFVPNIPRLDLTSNLLDESGYSSEIHVSMPSELESPDSDSSKSGSLISMKHEILSNTLVDSKKGKTIHVLENIEEHHLPQSRKQTKNDKNDSAIEIIDDSDLHIVSVDDINKNKHKEKTVSKNRKNKSSDEDTASRPDTPTWDYYDIPDEVVSQKVEDSTSPWKKGAAPVILPMQTTMEITGNKESVPFKKEKSSRRSKKKSSVPIPGRAVPLVPNIVITNAEHDNGKTKTVKDKDKSEQIRIDIPEKYCDKEQIDEGKIDYDLERGARPKTKSVLKKLERTSFINVGKIIKKDVAGKTNEIMADPVVASTLEKEKDEMLTKSKPKFRKLKKVVGSNIEINSVPGNDQAVTSVIGESSIKSDGLGSKIKNVPHFRPSSDNQPFKGPQAYTSIDISMNKLVTEKPASNTGETSPSVVLDMEKLAFSASGAHVIELIEDDISITELNEDDPLFTDRSEASVSTFTDLEIGEGGYQFPTAVSPTKYMIPMQVYDVDDTSCDESVSCDKSYIPVTEL